MKKTLFFHLSYYVLFLLIYVGFLFGSTALFSTSNLGAAIVIAYGLLFLGTPLLIAVMMRFSLLKWYVDPFAAAEVPLFLYVFMICQEMNRSGTDFWGAVVQTNATLGGKGVEGWLLLVGLFIFGLIASFSIARKNGESISYRLLSKIGRREGVEPLPYDAD